jgi:creatinine amidohydrolase/Fe(II)-dependent formamide hydrolase-like protein
MNGHDVNIAPIEVASRSAKVAHPDFKIVSLDAWWMMVGELLPKDFFAVWNGLGHGGEGETSICLELFPELCDVSNGRGGAAPAQIPGREVAVQGAHQHRRHWRPDPGHARGPEDARGLWRPW